MSDALARLSDFDARPSLYAPQFTNIAHLLSAAKNETPSASSFGTQPTSNRFVEKPYPMNGNVAMIPVTGVLLNRYGWAGAYASGYNFIGYMLDAALADPDVKGIALDVNSNGGMVQGCFELADRIFAGRSKKPIVAFVDANAHSAAYALASAATRIVATRSASVGSIGVVQMHVDYSKMLEEAGIKVSFIYAGDHKVDGNPYEALSPSVKKELQAEVDAIYGEFVALVARNRGIDEKTVRKTEAQTYGTAEALELGLIDAVASSDDGIAAFVKEVSASTISTNRSTKMSNENAEAQQTPGIAEADHKAAVAAAAAEARVAERARIAGIVNSDEAKERTALATHLAFETEMSVDAAKGILTAAPVTAPAKADGGFAAAMASGNPEVGADAAPEPEAGKVDGAQRMLASFAAATGRKIN